MDIFYCKIKGGNFGDDMNEWFWDELFPEYKEIYPDYKMFGIGSILGSSFLEGHKNIIVAGSGSGYGPFPKQTNCNIRYGWVRGPMTAKNLGLEKDCALTDPACMLPTLPEFKEKNLCRNLSLFIPHCGTERLSLDWKSISESAGLTYLSPADNSKYVIGRIAESKLVITESLHGAIVADAFRVPWLPISISPTFNSFKWQDWAYSMQINIDVATSLGAAKYLFYYIKKFRKYINSQINHNPPQERVSIPVGSLQSKGHEYYIDENEKRLVRLLIKSSASIIESIIVKDLIKLQKRKPYISNKSILEERQQQIKERIFDIRSQNI